MLFDDVGQLLNGFWMVFDDVWRCVDDLRMMLEDCFGDAGWLLMIGGWFASDG